MPCTKSFLIASSSALALMFAVLAVPSEARASDAGCVAEGSDCIPVTQLGEMDPCCSGHCSPITYTCLAPGDPGPACVPSGQPCTAKGGQCCDFNEVCDYHASPTMTTCGARPPPPGDCAGDCDAGGGGGNGGGDGGGGASSSGVFPPASPPSSSTVGSSATGCACDVTGGGQPVWPAASLAAFGLAALVARLRRRPAATRKTHEAESPPA